MTSEQLERLHQNPFYIQAHEFFLRDSTVLWELLEEMDWSPATHQQKERVRLQRERTNQSRRVLQELRDRVLPAQEKHSAGCRITWHVAAPTSR